MCSIDILQNVVTMSGLLEQPMETNWDYTSYDFLATQPTTLDEADLLNLFKEPTDDGQAEDIFNFIVEHQDEALPELSMVDCQDAKNDREISRVVEDIPMADCDNPTNYEEMDADKDSPEEQSKNFYNVIGVGFEYLLNQFNNGTYQLDQILDKYASNLNADTQFVIPTKNEVNTLHMANLREIYQILKIYVYQTNTSDLSEADFENFKSNPLYRPHSKGKLYRGRSRVQNFGTKDSLPDPTDVKLNNGWFEMKIGIPVVFTNTEKSIHNSVCFQYCGKRYDGFIYWLTFKRPADQNALLVNNPVNAGKFTQIDDAGQIKYHFVSDTQVRRFICSISDNETVEVASICKKIPNPEQIFATQFNKYGHTVSGYMITAMSGLMSNPTLSLRIETVAERFTSAIKKLNISKRRLVTKNAIESKNREFLLNEHEISKITKIIQSKLPEVGTRSQTETIDFILRRIDIERFSSYNQGVLELVDKYEALVLKSQQIILERDEFAKENISLKEKNDTLSERVSRIESLLNLDI